MSLLALLMHLPASEAVLVWDQGAERALQRKVANRIPLSDADRAAKERILALLPAGKTSGVLFTSATFQIEYIRSADVFQVEIKTTDMGRAKQDAIAWFTDHGFSFTAICNHPVMFSLDWDTKTKLEALDRRVFFSTMAPRCQ
jgi:hypothetical protein